MRLIILEDYKEMSAWAANHVVNRINEFQPTADKPFVLGLPTGSTPLGMYTELIRLNREKKVSFEHVVTFNMDEYIGIPKDHDQSYYTFMWKNFFSHIDIKEENTNILDGNALDPMQECQRFEDKIKSYGGVHLFIGGVGSDGHIAFNEPGSSLSSRTRVKQLSRETIMDNARFFEGDMTKVPTKAVTVGVGTVMDSQEVMILINGAHKANALKHAIEHGVNHMWTVSALQLHPNAFIACDEEATNEIKVSTYRFFKTLGKRDHKLGDIDL